MNSRRNFIGTFAGGIAGTLAARPGVLGANDRIRIGLIGAGDRGMQLAQELKRCEGAEIGAVADVFEERRERLKSAAPQARTYQDYRRLLEQRDIDAVLIATPQHLHAEQFIASALAGKHIYVEKALALTADDVKRMQAARDKQAGLVAQVGHQFCSSGLMDDAARFLAAGLVGRVTAIRAHMYRNTPHGKPQWRRPVLAGMTADKIAWDLFLGDAPRRDFDAHRFVNWRYFRDYSGGNVHEGMSQQIAFWYRALGLGIPEAVTMRGGTYLWDDGREVPDTMHVAMEHGGGLLFTWDSGFGNNHLGTGEYVLGTDGTIHRGQQLRYWPEKVNRPGGRETQGRTTTEPQAHLRNFLDSMRGQAEPACPFELGARVAITCAMAVASHRLGRTVYWDPAREEIV